MEPNPEKNLNGTEQLIPPQSMIREREAERVSRGSERWSPKEIAFAITWGVLWATTSVKLAEKLVEFILDLPK